MLRGQIEGYVPGGNDVLKGVVRVERSVSVTIKMATGGFEINAV